jgi:hypothetical protein
MLLATDEVTDELAEYETLESGGEDDAIEDGGGDSLLVS